MDIGVLLINPTSSTLPFSSVSFWWLAPWVAYLPGSCLKKAAVMQGTPLNRVGYCLSALVVVGFVPYSPKNCFEVLGILALSGMPTEEQFSCCDLEGVQLILSGRQMNKTPTKPEKDVVAVPVVAKQLEKFFTVHLCNYLRSG